MDQTKPVKRRSPRNRIGPEQRAFYVNIGRWMVENRQTLKIRQKEIALALSVSKSTVVQWEKGRTRISSFQLGQLAVIFQNMPPFHACLIAAAASTDD